MSHTISPEQIEQILQMKAAGKKNKDIAEHFKISEVTVYYITTDRYNPSTPKSEEPETVDFSELPANVLFKHARPWDFTG